MRIQNYLFGFCVFLGSQGVAQARSVFLNGQDVSSSRNQTLKNIKSLVIDERGDLFIEAPDYAVHEENSYLPLSTWVKGVNVPEHRPAGEMGARQSGISLPRQLPEPNQGEATASPSTALPVPNDGFEPLTPQPAPAMNPKPGQKSANAAPAK